MNQSWLRSFVAVGEDLSFTKAAARLRISQPTLSHQVRLLEKALEVQLLDRNTHQVRLTSAGRAVLTATRRIFSEFEHLEKLAREWREGVAGEITVGAVPSVSTYVLPGYLQAFRREYPAIHIAVVSKPQSEVLQRLLSGQIDVGFVLDLGNEPVLPHFERIVVAESKLVFICGPQCQNRCPNFDRNHLKFTELAWERIIFQDSKSPEQRAIAKAFAGDGIRIKPVLESEQIETIKKMVEAGMGCAILPEFTVKEEVQSGRLTYKEWFSGGIRLKALALYPKDRTGLRAHRTFLDLLRRPSNPAYGNMTG